MAERSVHLTKSGIGELQSEQKKLKARRVVIAKNLKAAKDQGDLTENSDWSNAQDEFKYVENRLAEIDYILKNAKIISAPGNSQVVLLGSTVHLAHNGHSKAYTIVGSLESNPGSGKISDESPIGRSVIGKKIGEQVEITLPSGTEKYTIAKID